METQQQVLIIDSDGDTISNYLDPDDDGDGIDTINENPDPKCRRRSSRC